MTTEGINVIKATKFYVIRYDGFGIRPVIEAEFTTQQGANKYELDNRLVNYYNGSELAVVPGGLLQQFKLRSDK